MDTCKHLILLKGEDRTKDIQSCQYCPQTGKYNVTFSGGKTYHYALENIVWLQNPWVRDPGMYRVWHDGRMMRNIRQILEFRGSQTQWHIVFENGSERTYPLQALTIERSCLEADCAQDRLAYLREIAGINALKNDDGEVLLKKQYEKLTFLSEKSALANYLYPEQYPVRQMDAGTLIFPFGGNASQFQAVRNALTQQISVIQGPPGTGKTQTILNITANLLIRGKKVQIVSNNNSATQNVLDKLASPKYGLDFLAATLGRRENKQAFVDGQTGAYPTLAAWERSPQALQSLGEQVEQLSREVSECFSRQERLAMARQEWNDLALESQHFARYYADSGLPRPTRAHRQGLRAADVLRILQECERSSEAEKPISLWLKLKGTVLRGVFEWRFWNGDGSAVIAYLQSLFYTLKSEELQEEIRSLEAFLADANAAEKMELLSGCSMEYLKASLFRRYGNRTARPRFTMDTLWKAPQTVLDEYPIILSTTFSARSCLKDVTYDYLIMDEASQVDLATGALALSSARNAVIVGDLKQLPNVIPEDLRMRSEAVFQHHQLPAGYDYARNSFLKSVCTVIPEAPQTLLREHYRCHPKIIGFCNQKFYQNQLVVMTQEHGEPDTLCVYQTAVGEHHRGHVNQRQIDVTREEVLPRLSDMEPEEIGIIAPYRDQVGALAAAMQGTGVEVDTVHKFQGREKDAIILTTVDDRVTDFSDDPYLLNVAISRAKKKLCLVVSGNEQPEDSNIRDLIAYIRYHNFQVVDSQIYSVFDRLYQQYTQERIAYLAKHRKVSQYDSENLMYAAIVELLSQMPELPLDVICHQKVRMLLRDTGKLTEQERRYAMHPNTHVDFLIYNRITKAPVLAIEVDGFRFHQEGTQQAARDKLKNSIFEKYAIPLLRLPTNGSGEIEKIRSLLHA